MYIYAEIKYRTTHAKINKHWETEYSITNSVTKFTLILLLAWQGIKEMKEMRLWGKEYHSNFICKASRLRRWWPAFPKNHFTQVRIQTFLCWKGKDCVCLLQTSWCWPDPSHCGCDNSLFFQLSTQVWWEHAYKPPTRKLVFFCSATFYFYVN